jgi:hypothetical protein
MNVRRIYTEHKIEITGVISWIVFTYGAIILIPIYVTKEFTHVIIYGLCSLLFLLFFFLHYRTKFRFIYFLILILVFNIGFALLQVLYEYLIDLEPPRRDIGDTVELMLADLALCSFFYFVINGIIKQKKR